jgi:hypothetical protein
MNWLNFYRRYLLISLHIPAIGIFAVTCGPLTYWKGFIG